MKNLPLEIVLARLSHFRRQLQPDPVENCRSKFEITEDFEEAISYVAKTSGFGSVSCMMQALTNLF